MKVSVQLLTKTARRGSSRVVSPGLIVTRKTLVTNITTSLSVCSAEGIMSTNEEVSQKGGKVQTFKQRRSFGEVFALLCFVASCDCGMFPSYVGVRACVCVCVGSSFLGEHVIILPTKLLCSRGQFQAPHLNRPTVLVLYCGLGEGTSFASGSSGGRVLFQTSLGCFDQFDHIL